MDNQFYITLPSNTRGDQNNTASDFTIRLPHRLVLAGEWECSLTEIVYPHTWENLSEKDATFYIIDTETKDSVAYTLPSGFYFSAWEIIKTIQWKLENSANDKYPNLHKAITIAYSEHTKKAYIHFATTAAGGIIFSPHLAHMLGFGSTHNHLAKIAEFHPDMRGGFECLYVYCSVIEPQIVGDVLAPLLRIVNIEGKHGEIVEKIYPAPHYVPIQLKDINSIQIQLKDDTDRPINFLSGKVIVKLHFRKRFPF